MEVDFQLLTGDLPPELLTMAPVDVHPHLRGLSPTSPFIAVAARLGSKPIALGVAQRGEPAEVRSLFVIEELWNQGLGTHLLTVLESLLAQAGARAARVRYSTEGRATEALERVLAKRGWSAPEMEFQLVELTGEIVEKAGWIQRRSLGPPYELFPWVEITDAERRELEENRASITANLWPFADVLPPEPSTSVGLRLEGRVIGWMLTHLVGPQTLRFTTTYVREPWRSAVVTAAIMAEAGKRAYEVFGPSFRAAMAVEASNTAMRKIYDRKFRRWAAKWHEARQATKRLV